MKYNIQLTKVDAAAKLKVIKEVKNVLNIGLKEAKEKVEAAPCMLFEALDFEKMEKMKEQLEKAGAVLTISN